MSDDDALVIAGRPGCCQVAVTESDIPAVFTVELHTARDSCVLILLILEQGRGSGQTGDRVRSNRGEGQVKQGRGSGQTGDRVRSNRGEGQVKQGHSLQRETSSVEMNSQVHNYSTTTTAAAATSSSSTTTTAAAATSSSCCY